MNLDQTENYNQDDQNFQNDETGYEGQQIESASGNHTISNNAEPDFGNDLNTEEFNNNKLGNENLGNNEFDKDEFDSNNSDNEFEAPDDDELGTDEFDDEGLGSEDEDENNTDSPV